MELDRLRAEARRLDAEAAKLERERQLYPVVLFTGASVALGTIAGLVLRTFL